MLHAPPRHSDPAPASASDGLPRRWRGVSMLTAVAAAIAGAAGCTPSRGSVYAVTLRGDVMDRVPVEPERYAAAFPENLGPGGLRPIELASVD